MLHLDEQTLKPENKANESQYSFQELSSTATTNSGDTTFIGEAYGYCSGNYAIRRYHYLSE